VQEKRKRPRSFLNVAFIYAGNDLLSHVRVARAPPPAKRAGGWEFVAAFRGLKSSHFDCVLVTDWFARLAGY
jgi:hypothetical protein